MKYAGKYNRSKKARVKQFISKAYNRNRKISSIGISTLLGLSILVILITFINPVHATMPVIQHNLITGSSSGTGGSSYYTTLSYLLVHNVGDVLAILMSWTQATISCPPAIVTLNSTTYSNWASSLNSCQNSGSAATNMGINYAIYYTTATTNISQYIHILFASPISEALYITGFDLSGVTTNQITSEITSGIISSCASNPCSLQQLASPLTFNNPSIVLAGISWGTPSTCNAYYGTVYCTDPSNPSGCYRLACFDTPVATSGFSMYSDSVVYGETDSCNPSSSSSTRVNSCGHQIIEAGTTQNITSPNSIGWYPQIIASDPCYNCEWTEYAIVFNGATSSNQGIIKVSDAFHLVDSLPTSFGLKLYINDSFNLRDNAAVSNIARALIQDAFHISDTAIMRFPVKILLQDSFSLLDILNKANKISFLSINDSMAITEFLCVLRLGCLNNGITTSVNTATYIANDTAFDLFLTAVMIPAIVVLAVVVMFRAKIGLNEDMLLPITFLTILLIAWGGSGKIFPPYISLFVILIAAAGLSYKVSGYFLGRNTGGVSEE